MFFSSSSNMKVSKQAGRFFSSSLIMRFILEPGVLSSGSSEVYPPDRYLVQVPV